MISPNSKSFQAHGALEAELLNEKAESLGRAGRAAEQALKALAEADAAEAEREALIDRAAEKVWAFLVQRELCGFVTSAGIFADLQVPPEVVTRLGTVRRGAGSSR